MKITHFLYNAFLVEEGAAKIAVDPGQNLWMFRLESLIPKSEWPTVTHIVVTHGDPDHYWQTDRVADASGAHVICGVGLTRNENGRTLVVDPRGRGLTSWIEIDNLHPVKPGESVTLDGITFEAIASKHGAIAVPVLGFTIRQQPGPNERVGLGSMAFRMTLGNHSVLNVGDSLLLPQWEGLAPDVLMLPIGGMGESTWTMDVDDALQAVELIGPKKVIPCHYNLPFLWKRRFARADDLRFQREAEKLGVECIILGSGESVTV